MTRIRDLNMTTLDVIVALAGGNPGAAMAMADILERGDVIDPDSALGGMGAIFDLDTFGIYEHRIWMLYKDLCGHSALKTIAALRAVQMGLRSLSDLNAAIDGKRDRFDVDAALADLQRALPAFGRQQGAAA